MIKTEHAMSNNLKTYKISHLNMMILNRRHQIANTKIINNCVVSGI